MPKIITKGVGLMKRKVALYNPDEDPEAFLPGGAIEAAFLKCRTADGYRDAYANHVRQTLTNAYSKMDPAWFCRKAPQRTESIRADMKQRPQLYVKNYFGEDHTYAIMQAWLDRYDHLAAERVKPDPDVARMIELGEELGTFHERLYWRAGVDPDTGKRREVLALLEKNAVTYRDAGGAANKKASAARQAIARRIAAEIRAKRSKPLSALALARAVHDAWPDAEDQPPDVETMRKWKSLVKPDA